MRERTNLKHDGCVQREGYHPLMGKVCKEEGLKNVVKLRFMSIISVITFSGIRKIFCIDVIGVVY